MRRAKILGIGRYLPERRVTNFDLANMFETSDEWIQQRSGIVERRYADEGVYCSDLALQATHRALEHAKMKVEEVDFIILATLSPDHHFPGTACYLQQKLGVPEVGCLDIRNQCSGFIYSLSVADAFIRIGMYDRVLVVGSEVHSSALSYTKEGRDVTVLFGDVAGFVAAMNGSIFGSASGFTSGFAALCFPADTFAHALPASCSLIPSASVRASSVVRSSPPASAARPSSLKEPSSADDALIFEAMSDRSFDWSVSSYAM